MGRQDTPTGSCCNSCNATPVTPKWPFTDASTRSQVGFRYSGAGHRYWTAGDGRPGRPGPARVRAVDG
ncbi:hypothetical protein [Streptomyces sp. CB00455]|uniref:hypothetical protein n=1 Tax=Streptomyces sp. CB00455 TaxID=1703927 RepID=UPI0011611ACE|nr:hypothetical protein [Streptomyces sp. CB00455]